MSLEEPLRNRAISRIRPSHKLAQNTISRARRDVDTAKTLVANEKFDWSLAASYNAMLLAGRALMLDRGYRPSSTKGHVAVVNFLHATLGSGISDRMIIVMNGMRKKRHRIIYEEMDIVSKDEAEQAVRWAEEFVNRVDKLIHQTKSLNRRRMNASKSV